MEVEKNLEDDVSDGSVGDEATSEPASVKQNSLTGVKTRRALKRTAAAVEAGKIVANSKESTPNGDVNMLDKDDVSSEETVSEAMKIPPEESEAGGESDAPSPKDGSADEEPENQESAASNDETDVKPENQESAASNDETDVKPDIDGETEGKPEEKQSSPSKNAELPSKEIQLPSKVSEKPDIKMEKESSNDSKPAESKGNDEEVEDDDDYVGSDSDAEALAEIVKSKKESKTIKTEKSDKNESGNSAASRSNKDQTIIITETKSLAQAINDAVKQPDGKPTLVIIETKSPTTTSSGSNGVVTSSTSSASAKSKVVTRQSSQQPYQNSLRTALLQGSFGMTTRAQSRPSPTTQSPPVKATTKADGSQGIALQDDAEVNVYTPSLLVPYLFESPPKESLVDFVRKIAPPEVAKAEEEKRKKEQEEIDDCEPPLPSTKPKKTFFDLALGQFFVDIGLSQAQQWVQTEILKSQKKKLDKGWKTKERENMVHSLQRNLADIKVKNKPFTFGTKKCKRCNFLTESQTVLDNHLETIHVVGVKMFCSYCEFTTIEASQIFHHLYIQHKAFGRLERPPTIHMCPVCPFEDTAKARVTRHMWKCLKAFVPDKNLAPPVDFEPPAKRLRHLASVATLKAMRAGVERETAAVNAAALAQQRQAAANSLLSLSPLLAQGRGGPQPIRPKPGDLRLTPTYVQSVLRGAYGNPPVSVRGLSPAIATQSMPSSMTTHAVMRTTVPVRAGAPQAHSQSAYLTSRQQNTSTITPVSASPTFSLHGNQLYQVVQTSSSSVPLVRASATSSNFTPPRFTILPTAPATVNTRGPTPVALIPNLASTNKPTTVSCTTTIGINTNSYSGALRTTTISTLARTTAQLSAKPNISITPVSRPMPTRSSTVSSSTPTPKAASSSSNANPSRAQQPSNPSYVVCEICDGYIKDLDQLRNHMQWIHKVKIHPKMIHNRPPLNCQKCHFRFFTDQGLERHLLGSHGLVTSSMQENANKGKDGGRCIICGKVFLWKLVIHMAKDHKMTLKPAHLSYKCTVCSATFNMYRLFETHVYEEHSTVAKRVLDGQKSYSPLPQPSTPLPKSKVTITPSLASSDVTIRKALAANRGSGISLMERGKPIEVRYCTDCGEEITRSKKCISHWEKSNLKPCDVKLCRIDVCDLCITKADEEARVASNGKSTSSKGAKKNHCDDDCEIVEDSPPPAKKAKIEVEIVSADKQTEQSDCDDIFDMEVETVDDDHQSSGDCRSEAECQSD